MAQVMGTNVVADGSAEYALIMKALDELEKFLLQHEQNKEAQLTRRLNEYIAHGGQGSFVLIEKKYEADLKKKLCDADMPFSVIYDNSGHAGFIVRDIDADRFVEFQKEVFAKDTTYFAQITLEELQQISRNSGEKELIKISFNNIEDFYEAQVKFYTSGVVVARGESETALYVSPTDYYNSRGNDLTTFEVEWAMNQVMNDEMFREPGELDTDSKLQQLRSSQAKHDVNMNKAMSIAAKNGVPVVMVDAKNTSNTYIEMGTGGLSVYKKEGSGWREAAHLTRKDLQQMSKTQIGAFVSKHGYDIKNSIVIDASNKSKILDASSVAAHSFAKAWASQTREEKVLTENKEGGYDETNATYPAYIHPLIEIEVSIRKDEKTIESPIKDKLLEAEKLKKGSFNTAIKAVEMKARQRVEATPGLNTRKQKQDALRAEMDALLQRESWGETPEIQAFLDTTTTYINTQEKEKMLELFSEHLQERNEEKTHEAKVDSVGLDKLREDVRREKELEEERGQKEFDEWDKNEKKKLEESKEDDKSRFVE